jgi:hypothetical protein
MKGSAVWLAVQETHCKARRHDKSKGLQSTETRKRSHTATTTTITITPSYLRVVTLPSDGQGQPKVVIVIVHVNDVQMQGLDRTPPAHMSRCKLQGSFMLGK